jgi:hypothetical protein
MGNDDNEKRLTIRPTIECRMQPVRRCTVSNSWERTFIGIVVCAAAVAVGTACGTTHEGKPGGATSNREEPFVSSSPDHQVRITADPQRAGAWQNIIPTKVKRNEVVQFVAEDAMAWILIPDDHLEFAGGEGVWTTGKGFVAFEVTGEGTQVRVPADYPDGEHHIHYAVMVMQDGVWAYVHGSNPPPVIIIRSSVP